jgi:glycosyltransferase involved in cell wall biosynthesis
MRVSAIIPAYNEEKTICQVVNSVKNTRRIGEIIVVSDGSIDNTAINARKCNVNVIELKENGGKGAAIKAGLEACSGDVILLLDADLVGLLGSHIEDLLSPVLDHDYDMSIGVFTKGRLATDLAHRILPYLSGQRALKRSILESISSLPEYGYGLETAMTLYAYENKLRVKHVELSNLTHIMKEEKYGFYKGMIERFKMYRQVLKGARYLK